MFCRACGCENDDSARYCVKCASPLRPKGSGTEEVIADTFDGRPMSVGKYFGFELLFIIPVVGLILSIVFSFAGSDKNLKNFARSFLCLHIIAIIVILIVLLVKAVGNSVRPAEADDLERISELLDLFGSF